MELVYFTLVVAVAQEHLKVVLVVLVVTVAVVLVRLLVVTTLHQVR
tara:strand:- start:193 stop:330 length:138 start_codon:yes stop_codon:yes gene_type:complete